ncbi:MAG: tRNA pseudouridine(38-40) synthase TruA [Bacteroidia bacterium]|nr:tRNA pseudouridine(38-40) synthase TruA [Bacteroidia bacterium]
MNRYILHLAYCGKNYHGWQRQPGVISVQERLEDCLEKLVEPGIQLIGAGRTDTGVHATTFFAHFDCSREFSAPAQARQLVYRMNRFLPADIVIYALYEAQADFHARFSAISRKYTYYISLAKNPFKQDFCYTLQGKLDLEAMNTACTFLQQYADFSCFAKSHTQTKTNNCVIRKARWIQKGDTIIFEIEANRFLRNMVRAIVGTMLEIGQNKMQPEAIHTIIQSGDRGNAGVSVPAKGLFLDHVEYPGQLMKKLS